MLTSGFFNSANGDRKYNADHMSAIFNGIINDGIFMSEGNTFMVIEGANMVVNVGTGRAWFNGKWILNNATYAIALQPAEAILNRIDVVILEINESDLIRACSIRVVEGTPGAFPVAPILTNTEEAHQYPLAEIYVGASVSEIIQANITNKVGSSECPFVTGILDTVDTDALVIQWQSQFDDFMADNNSEFQSWFQGIQNILDENTAGTLYNLIVANQNAISDNTTNINNNTVAISDIEEYILMTERSITIGGLI